MIDREKVVCAIENCIGQPKCKDCPWEDCEVEHEVVNMVPYGLLRDALALLKDQEPVSPIDENYWNHTLGRCGHCKAPLPAIEGLRSKFCWMCGQAVKWEE